MTTKTILLAGTGLLARTFRKAPWTKNTALLRQEVLNLIGPKGINFKYQQCKNCCVYFLQEYTLLHRFAEASFELGNDEAHYTKIYQDKGLKDLKEFIKATVNQIEAILYLQELNRVRAEKDK